MNKIGSVRYEHTAVREFWPARDVRAMMAWRIVADHIYDVFRWGGEKTARPVSCASCTRCCLCLHMSSYTISSQVHVYTLSLNRSCKMSFAMSAKVYVRCCMCVVRSCAAIPQLAASTLRHVPNIRIWCDKTHRAAMLQFPHILLHLIQRFGDRERRCRMSYTFPL